MTQAEGLTWGITSFITFVTTELVKKNFNKTIILWLAAIAGLASNAAAITLTGQPASSVWVGGVASWQTAVFADKVLTYLHGLMDFVKGKWKTE